MIKAKVISIIGGVAAVTIAFLLWQNSNLREDNISLMVDNAQLAELSVNNADNAREILGYLKECVDYNAEQEQNSRQTVENLQKELEEALKDVRTETITVKEALTHEACADVTIPSDIERVLRNGAARADGDS